MASRTSTPQPGWAQGGGGLALPAGKAGKAPAGAATRAGSADPDGGAPNGAGGGDGAKTDVNSLMDAVGASGVDLNAEEDSLRATNERMHAQAMAAQASGQGSNPHAYAGVDRSRKQDFMDPQLLAECVKKVAAAYQLKTLEPDTIPLIALATRHRLMSLVNSAIAARDHRQSSSHFRVPPFVAPSSTTSRKRRRRGALDPDLDEDGNLFDDDSDDEMEDVLDAEGAGARPKVPAWDTLVYDDPERYLSVLERVDREEERRKRRERMVRDQREQEARELAEAMAASEAARLALEAEGKGPDGQPLPQGKEKKPEAGPVKDVKGKGKGKAAAGGDAPSTPGGKGELGKDGKPKKSKKKKAATGGADAGAGGSGTSTPASASTLPASGTKNLAEDIKKRMTDQTALRSLGGQKFSWLNAGIGSPSPAGLGGVGGAGGLPKPKFAPGSALPPPSFTPIGGAGGGGANGAASTSGLNPANNATSTPGASSSTPAPASNPTAQAAAALTTSRLNIPPLHDAQRTQLARDEWAAGHHVVELGDLLFALERERGMGVGRGSGRNTAIRGRAGVTKAGGGGRGGAQAGR
ncbi:hypothetical protein JCM10207_006906 [Rhodosporidiobolus poonsookiae]